MRKPWDIYYLKSNERLALKNWGIPRLHFLRLRLISSFQSPTYCVRHILATITLFELLKIYLSSILSLRGSFYGITSKGPWIDIDIRSGSYIPN